MTDNLTVSCRWSHSLSRYLQNHLFHLIIFKFALLFTWLLSFVFFLVVVTKLMKNISGIFRFQRVHVYPFLDKKLLLLTFTISELQCKFLVNTNLERKLNEVRNSSGSVSRLACNLVFREEQRSI